MAGSHLPDTKLLKSLALARVTSSRSTRRLLPRRPTFETLRGSTRRAGVVHAEHEEGDVLGGAARQDIADHDRPAARFLEREHVVEVAADLGGLARRPVADRGSLVRKPHLGAALPMVESELSPAQQLSEPTQLASRCEVQGRKRDLLSRGIRVAQYEVIH
jgi:hypothetical protein